MENLKTVFVSIEDIKVGDRVKITYKDEDSDSDKMYFIYDDVVSISREEKYVETSKKYKVYGAYEKNNWFKIVAS